MSSLKHTWSKDTKLYQSGSVKYKIEQDAHFGTKAVVSDIKQSSLISLAANWIYTGRSSERDDKD